MRRDADLTVEAEGDLTQAYEFYESQLVGLGDRFLASFEDQLERIVEQPLQYQVRHRDIRRAVMRRFPYAVFYVAEPERVIVLAVEHQARHPDRWIARVDEDSPR